MTNSKDASLIAKGTIFVFASLILGKFFSYLFTLLVARIGTREYGVLSISFAIMEFLVLLSLLGLPEGVERFVAYYNGKGKKEKVRGVIFDSAVFTLGLSVFFAIGFFVFSPQISVLFNEPLLIPVLRIVILALPFFALLRIFSKSLFGFKKAPQSAVISEIIWHGLKFGFAIVFVFVFSYGVFGAAIAYSLSIAISALLLLYFLLKNSNVFKKKEHSIKLLFSYSFPLLFFSILYIIIGKIDVLMIGHFISSEATGIYNAALPTATLINLFPVALMSMFFPIITEKFSREEDISGIYKIVSKWLLLFVFPLSLIMVLFSSQILNIMFGSEYIGGALSLSILAMGFFVYGLNFPNLNILKMLGRSKHILIITLFATLINVVFNYFLIQKYGMIGGAISTSIAYLIIALLSFAFVRKFLPNLKFFSSKGFLVLVSAIVPFAIVYFLKEITDASSIFALILLGALFCIIYFLLLYFTKAFDKEDIEILRKIKKRATILRNAGIGRK